MNRIEGTSQKLSEPISRRELLRVMGAALTGIAVCLDGQNNPVRAEENARRPERFTSGQRLSAQRLMVDDNHDGGESAIRPSIIDIRRNATRTPILRNAERPVK